MPLDELDDEGVAGPGLRERSISSLCERSSALISVLLSSESLEGEAETGKGKFRKRAIQRAGRIEIRSFQLRLGFGTVQVIMKAPSFSVRSVFVLKRPAQGGAHPLLWLMQGFPLPY